jgi:hypothetical protein
MADLDAVKYHKAITKGVAIASAVIAQSLVSPI